MKCVQGNTLNTDDVKSGENVVNSLNIFFVFLEVLINCILEKQAELTKHTQTHTHNLFIMENTKQ